METDKSPPEVRLGTERILLRGLRLLGSHGVRPEERERGQQLVFDVELAVERPSEADELSETVDYTGVIEQVRSVNESRSFQLLESLARAVARALVEENEWVRSARVRVHKRLLRSSIDLEWVAAEANYVRESSR